MTLIDIIIAVESVCRVGLRDISRKRHVVDARRIFAYIATKHTSLSLDCIGKAIGKNHAMVVHYRDSAKDILDVDDMFRNKYEKVLRRLDLSPDLYKERYYFHLDKARSYAKRLKDLKQ